MRTTHGVTTANDSVEPIVLTEDKAYVRINITPIDNARDRGYARL